RWLQQFASPPLLALADQLCHGALVVGDWQPCDLLRAAPDWSRQVCRLRIGSGETSVHTDTHSLGDPAWLLADWLRHATEQYGTLGAGTVVTTGSWVGLARAQAGDSVHVQFDGVGEAWLQL
ncbi:fumarylacetoacetate hydrolase family protein, partial [Acidovorax cavernicola]